MAPNTPNKKQGNGNQCRRSSSKGPRWSNNKKKSGGGYNSNNNSGSSGTGSKYRDPELKFAPQVNGKVQATYDTIMDHLCLYIQKEFKDGEPCATSLRTMKKVKFKMPIRKIATLDDLDDLSEFEEANEGDNEQELEPIVIPEDADDETRARLEVQAAARREAQRRRQQQAQATREAREAKLKALQESIDQVHSEDIKLYVKRRDQLEKNLTAAAALIYQDYCTHPMKRNLESLHGFKEEIRNDPFKLLTAISVAMHTSVRGQYEMITIVNHLLNLFTTTQREGENINDFVKRFQQLRDIFAQHVGTSLLDDWVTKQPEWATADTEEKKTELKAKAWKQLTAYLLLKNADSDRYESLMRHFRNQYALGNDQYPKTVQAAHEAMFANKADPNYYEKLKRKKQSNLQGSKPTPTTQFGLTFAQREKKSGVCYGCGDPNHKSPACTHKDKPKEEWFYRNFFQEDEVPTRNRRSERGRSKSRNNKDNNRSESPNWCGLQLGSLIEEVNFDTPEYQFAQQLLDMNEGQLQELAELEDMDSIPDLLRPDDDSSSDSDDSSLAGDLYEEQRKANLVIPESIQILDSDDSSICDGDLEDELEEFDRQEQTTQWSSLIDMANTFKPTNIDVVNAYEEAAIDEEASGKTESTADSTNNQEEVRLRLHQRK